MEFVDHVEGRTHLLVPPASLKEIPPPTSPAFFNPAAALNRDVTVAVASATGASTFCDSMAGVGARGLRVALEARGVEEVTMVDFNAEAVRAARLASARNGIRRKCEFSASETDSFLYSRFGRDQRFDSVDVDPFGTPVRHVQAALSATSDGGHVSFTATDTAVLCGVYPKVSARRYGAVSLNNHFHNESGIRVLAGSVARLGAALDIGVEPVAAHAARHYLRLFARVHTGASRADESLKPLGYIAWCPACGHTTSTPSNYGRCEKCRGVAKTAGPLWLGNLTDGKLVRASSTAAADLGLAPASKVLLSLAGSDSFPPWSFSIELICSRLGVPTVSEAAVGRYLAEKGHRAMRTPFEKTGIKTDAEITEVVEAVSRSRAGDGRS